MPKIGKHDPVEVKLDTGAAFVHAAIPEEMRRGLWERPGTSVFAVVQLSSVSYSGHADGEDKEAQVKVRVTLCEVARDNHRVAQLTEILRALHRERQMNGTLDGQDGIAEADVEIAVSEALATMPTEDEYERWHEQRRGRSARVEQHA
ncbi:hypothetical protein VWBp14 [Streptomyces phage VWB]|uniref:Uncharacterized protein n=1 Tax=Streptomyces phage VWB TaxID=10702 RepID=Q6VY75_9CAUD|nr:hypothetical protein VWBp14 [Streptomyces phage VWB]AAR29704.1 hypothetical protein [Streptomyces phage VWB]